VKKKVFGFLLVAFSFFIGLNCVSALTNNELTDIEKEVDNMFYFGFEFEEGDTLSFAGVAVYIGYTFDGWMDEWDSEYILGFEYPEAGAGPMFKVPKEVYENYIISKFNVDEFWVEEYRENFNSVDNGVIYDTQYVEENGEYYYKYTMLTNAGSAMLDFLGIKGYKDLGNGYYQIYFYGGFRNSTYPLEEQIKEDAVLGLDYVIAPVYNYETNSYELKEIKIDVYGTYKIYYNNNDFKFVSSRMLERDNFPKDDEINLYEREVSLFISGANQKFDNKEGKKLIFRIDIDFSLFDKVYINGVEVDPKYYAATEGSTVITFNDEYTKTLKNGNYELKVTFKDGTEAETTFTVANTVDNTKTGLYTGIGLAAGLALIGCSIVFVTTRKQSKFPQA